MNCQYLKALETGKKETELASGLSPLSQVEQRWQFSTGLAKQYYDN
jgi:hypothetical protein